VVYASRTRTGVVAVVRGARSANEASLQTATGAQILRPGEDAGKRSPVEGPGPARWGGLGLTTITVFITTRAGGDDHMGGGGTGRPNRKASTSATSSVPRELGRTAKAVRSAHVNAAKAAPSCGEPLAVGKALEVGQIFKLGATRYSDGRWAARVPKRTGKLR